MRVVLAALLTLLAAAARGDDELPEFSHKSHVGVYQAACADCHDTRAARPRVDPQRCLACHEGGAPRYRLAGAARRPGPAFPHDRHIVVACAGCHAATLDDRPPPAAGPTAREPCVQCHAGRRDGAAGAACARCHVGDRRRSPPRDHDAGWMLRHGEESRWRAPGEHGRGCAQCHGRAACVSCHDQRAPRDHDGLWRVRMHGVAAGWDRDRCQACHEPGVCIRCHSTTPPPNHAGPWLSLHGLVAGGRDDERCLVCHRPATCAACHSRRSP